MPWSVVAPLAGAWIETDAAHQLIRRHLSRPSRARGSKLLHEQGDEVGALVAPLAGAWIETTSMVGT